MQFIIISDYSRIDPSKVLYYFADKDDKSIQIRFITGELLVISSKTKKQMYQKLDKLDLELVYRTR
jgi:hypothetical protein